MFLARHIDSIIMLAVGIWATGIGYGFIRFPVEGAGAPPFAIWFRRNARWIGPLVIAIALVLGAAAPS